MLILLGLILSLECAAQPGIPLAEYRLRREALRRQADGSVIILFGATAPAMGAVRSGFLQEPNFRYLTGWDEPGAILLLWPRRNPEADEDGEALLLPDRDAESEKWTGRKWSASDAGAALAAGVARVASRTELASLLDAVLPGAERVYTLLAAEGAAGVRALAAGREVADIRDSIARLRMKKSTAELELLRRSVAVTISAQRAAWKRVRPGVQEFQIAATLVGRFLERGCEGPAFRPVIGAGANSTVLHNTRYNSQLGAGDLIVIDTGAECAGYAADLTRTIPVSGRFSPRQRAIYDAVLRAQDSVIRSVKPGMTLGREPGAGLYRVAWDALAQSGIQVDGRPLSEFFTHGIGHHVGLEVHDAAVDVPLEAGMVITVEPGIYLPGEKLGVRIEDMVLVSQTGGVLLSGALPRAAGDVERALRP